MQLISLDTHKLKDTFHYRLSQAIQSNSKESEGTVFHQAAFLHSGTGLEYVSHILAEEKRQDRKKGTEEWVQVKNDNHLLDCEVICHALADPEWPGGGVNLIRKHEAVSLVDLKAPRGELPLVHAGDRNEALSRLRLGLKNRIIKPGYSKRLT